MPRSPLGPAVGIAILAGAFLSASCEPGEAPSGDPEVPVGEPAATPPTGDMPLIPAEAGFDQVNALVKDPFEDPLPEDSLLAAQIQLGFQIVENTPEHAAQYIGNTLSCGNCHLNAGQRFRALPYTGIAAVFPVPRRREARLFSLGDRIRGCFLRSMNGDPPPYDSEELLAVAAYITWLSEGQPMGESPSWRGQNVIEQENLISIEQLDPVRGRDLYVQHCTACHGVDGQGVDLQTVKPGPLWGPDSWNDGAGASRIYTLAGYIRYAMPLTQPGVLSDEEAQHISAYINAHDRPVYEAKEQDYEGGEAPIDAVYYPRYPENPLRVKLEAATTTAGR